MNRIRKTLIAVLLIGFSLVGFSQTYDGNLTLTTQAEVDAFNYIEVTGTLNIGYFSHRGGDIKNLLGLSKLNSLGGDLIINYQDNLNTLEGLEGLESIMGSLIIRFNDNLVTLSGLTSLNHLGGLQVKDNMTLSSLIGFESITSLDKSLDIKNNPNLISLTGLENLSSVGGLVIYRNDSLASLKGLDNIKSIHFHDQIQGGGLAILSNSNLISINNLNKIISIDGSLSISDNPSLISLTGLENLNSVGASLGISRNDSLTSLSGFEGLVSISENLSISEMINLTSLNGLNNLTSIGNDLIIFENSSLISLSGLGNLTNLGGGCYIGHAYYTGPMGNPALTDLCDIQQIIANGQVSISEYYLKYNGYNPTYEEIKTNCTEGQEETVSKPTLITPANEAINIPNNTASIFTWSESNWTDTTNTDPIAYQFHLWEAGETPVVQFVPAGNTSPNTVTTKQNTTYSWKVVAVDGQGTALATSETWSFTTKVDTVSSELTYIPDDNFEQVLIDRGLDDVLDDYVKTSNINSEVELFIRNKSITDLTGIEGFESLKELYCENNKITNLDLSKNSALEVLSCNYNEIENLNISGISGIKHLLCHSNKLVSLDVTQHLNLNSLLCSYNNIATLNFNNIYLDDLDCMSNNLSSLDVSKMPSLTFLNCGENSIQNLDISNNTLLRNLYCDKNQLNSLGLENNVNLINLECNDNQITALDLSNSSLLKSLYCSNNNLEILNIQNNNNSILEDFNAVNNPNLNCVEVDNVDDANAKWFNSIDNTIASFSENCFLPEKLNILNLDEELSNIPLTIFPGGVAHRYYKITDPETQEPVRGAVIKYYLENNLLSSSISNEDGVVDLNINIGGESSRKFDDIIIDEGTYQVSFDKITSLDESQVVEVIENDFNTSVEFLVKDFSKVEKTQGISFSGGISGSLKRQNSAMSSEIGASADSKVIFDVVFIRNEVTDDLEALDVVVKVKGELGLNTNLKQIVVALNNDKILDKVKVEANTSIATDSNVHGGIKVRLRFNSILTPIELRLYLLNTIFKVYNKISKYNVVTYRIENYLTSYLKKINKEDAILMPEIGSFHGFNFSSTSSGNLSLILDLKDESNKIFDVNLNKVEISFNNESGIKQGEGVVFNHDIYFENLNKTKDTYSNSIFRSIKDSHVVSFELDSKFKIKIPLFEEINYFQNKKVKLTHVFDIKNNNKQYGKVATIIETNAEDYNILGVDYAKSTKMEYEYGNNALNTLKGVNSTMSFFDELPVYSIDEVVKHVADIKTDILEDRINVTNWDINDFLYKKEISYTKSYDQKFSLSLFDAKAKFFKWSGEGELNADMSLGFNWGATYPLEKSIFVPNLKKMFPIYQNIGAVNIGNYVDEPAKSEVKELVEEGFGIFKNKFNEITDSIKDTFNEATDVVSEGYRKLTTLAFNLKLTGARNGIRNYSKTLVSTNDTDRTSVFEFSFKDDNLVFDDQTTVSLKHQFSNGELKGKLIEETIESDFLIISDLVYFNAIKNGVVLDKSLLDFNINVNLGNNELNYFGIDNNVNVELFYSPENQTKWESLGVVDSIKDFKNNNLGIYVLGVRLLEDKEKPVVSNVNTDVINKKVIYELTDNQSGINWSSLSIEVDGELIEYVKNENQLIITFPQDDNSIHFFDVWVEDNYGNTQSFNETISLNTLGVLKEELSVVQFYPNPVKNKLKINSGVLINEIEVYNALGSLVLKQKINLNKAEISLINLNAGIYIMKVKTSNSFKSYTVIKE